MRGQGPRLRQEIIDAATELLIQRGDDKLVSIRDVAGYVGVTSPSLYMHFDSKNELLQAVCAHHFNQLDEQLERIVNDGDVHIETLCALGRAYVNFAVQTPVLYRIATMGDGQSATSKDTHFDNIAFRRIGLAVKTLTSDGVFRSGDESKIALELWTALHGCAALAISKPHLPFGDIDSFVYRVIRAACCSHLAPEHIGSAQALHGSMTSSELRH